MKTRTSSRHGNALRSPVIFVSTVIALALAVIAIWVWGTRPEPTLMLFMGAELVILSSAARRRDRRNDTASTSWFGVPKS
jgi:hypothetical protein